MINIRFISSALAYRLAAESTLCLPPIGSLVLLYSLCLCFSIEISACARPTIYPFLRPKTARQRRVSQVRARNHRHPTTMYYLCGRHDLYRHANECAHAG